MSMLDNKSNLKTDAIFSNKKDIELYDAELWESFEKEMVRQEEHIELIASENYASQRVLQAQGSVLTNKYAEGYPDKRYYGGCEFVDIAEKLAIDCCRCRSCCCCCCCWRCCCCCCEISLILMNYPSN